MSKATRRGPARRWLGQLLSKQSCGPLTMERGRGLTARMPRRWTIDERPGAIKLPGVQYPSRSARPAAAGRAHVRRYVAGGMAKRTHDGL